MSQRQGKLSYCLNCKDMTETIIVETPYWLFFKSRDRVCKKCADPKKKTEIE